MKSPLTSPETHESRHEQLKVTSVSCADFRVYSRFALEDIGDLTIFVGPNAVGKTSVLEAIQLITGLESFRTSHVSQTVRWGAASARISALFESERRSLNMRLDIASGQRRYSLNGKGKSARALSGLLPAVVFSPDDLQMAKGAPSLRRKQIDSLGAQVSKNYYAVRSDYVKLVKQKNQALKAEMPDSFIDSIDEVLTRVGVQVLQHRLYLVDRIQPFFEGYYRSIAGGSERACLVYLPCWMRRRDRAERCRYEFDRQEALSELAQAISSHRTAERAQHRALIGPHADEVTFLVEGHDASQFASQGQQRSLVLAYKLAESAVIRELLGQKPVLLLDDVMSELDERRRRRFMEFISEGMQTFITTTNLSYFSFEMTDRARVVDLARLREREVDVSRETFSMRSAEGGFHDEAR